jgi:hypothetical protein
VVCPHLYVIYITQIDRNRSQVQGSTFRVKDKEGIKDPKFSLKMLISQIIANLAPNFGLGLMKLTLFS